LIILLPAGPFATIFPVTKTADTDDAFREYHASCILR
jgi:hypothetical protein